MGQTVDFSSVNIRVSLFAKFLLALPLWEINFAPRRVDSVDFLSVNITQVSFNVVKFFSTLHFAPFVRKVNSPSKNKKSNSNCRDKLTR